MARQDGELVRPVNDNLTERQRQRQWEPRGLLGRAGFVLVLLLLVAAGAWSGLGPIVADIRAWLARG